jgi:heme-degrading monooxygenase HmoA
MEKMTRTHIRKLPEPPYYTVIFTSKRSQNEKGYRDSINSMLALAAEQPGYLGTEGARDPDGFGITVSYWTTLEAFTAWSQIAEGHIAQASGRNRWFDFYALRIARVERAFGVGSPD